MVRNLPPLVKYGNNHKISLCVLVFIAAYKIGVKLTDSFMMIPKKSLSWAIGVGENVVTPSKKDDSARFTRQ